MQILLYNVIKKTTSNLNVNVHAIQNKLFEKW